MFYGIKCQEVQTESEEAPQREPENHTRLLEEGKTAREKPRENRGWKGLLQPRVCLDYYYYCR